MNRLHHLKRTLPKNIKDNCAYGNLEFIILNYNSSDGIEEWLLENLSIYLESGLVKVYTTSEPKYFHRSHSRNMAFKLATGDIICNVDADNFIGTSFAQFINDKFNAEDDIFLTPDFAVRDYIGRLCIRKEIFYQVAGYNEQFDGYGLEDYELYKRLEFFGTKHIFFKDEQYLSVIKHSNQERFAHEYIGQNLLFLYISYIDHHSSEILFLFNDYQYEQCIFTLNDLLVEDKLFEMEYELISLNKKQVKGVWERENRDIILHPSNRNKIKAMHIGDGNLRLEKQIFYEISDSKLKETVILMKTEITNKKKLNTINSFTKVNHDGFGKGKTVQSLTHI